MYFEAKNVFSFSFLKICEFFIYMNFGANLYEFFIFRYFLKVFLNYFEFILIKIIKK